MVLFPCFILIHPTARPTIVLHKGMFVRCDVLDLDSKPEVYMVAGLQAVDSATCVQFTRADGLIGYGELM